MKKNANKTPRSQVRSALRKLFLRSREHSACLKAESYTCEECNIKQSRRKGAEVYVEVHHLEGIGNWEKVIDLIFEELLCHPDKLQVLCKTCHDKLGKGH
jgi:predicted HNH restriction endonuclease